MNKSKKASHKKYNGQGKWDLLTILIKILNGRIAELKQEAANNMTESEKMQEELEPLPFRWPDNESF